MEGAGGLQCLTAKTSARCVQSTGAGRALRVVPNRGTGDRPSHLFVNHSLDVGWLHPERAEACTGQLPLPGERPICEPPAGSTGGIWGGGVTVSLSVLNLMAHLVAHHSAHNNEAKDTVTSGPRFIFSNPLNSERKDSRFWL